MTARHRRILVAATLVALFAAVPAGAEEPRAVAPEPGPSLVAPGLLDVVTGTLHVAVVGAGERPLEAVIWKGADMVAPPQPLEASFDEGGPLWRTSIDVSRVRNGLTLVEVRDRGPAPDVPYALHRHVVLSSPAPKPQVSATVGPSGTAILSWEGVGDVALTGARIDGRDGPLALLDPGQLRTPGSHALDGLEPGEHRLRVVAERLGGHAEVLETASDEVLVTVPVPPEAETPEATPGAPAAPGGVRAAQGGPPQHLEGGAPDLRHRDLAQVEGDDRLRRSNRPGLRSEAGDLAGVDPLPQAAPPLTAPPDTEEEATAAEPEPLAAPPAPLATDPPPPGSPGLDGDAVRLLGLLAAAGLVLRRLRTVARLARTSG